MLLHRMRSATVFQSFETAPFEMAKMKWTLRAYPNGDRSSNRGLFKVILKPDLDAAIREMVFFGSIAIGDHRCSATSRTERGDVVEATPIGIPHFDEVQALTVRVRVHILKVVMREPAPKESLPAIGPESAYPEHSSFTFSVKESVLREMASDSNSWFRISSAVHDQMWVLNLYHYPMWSTKMSFDLKLARFIPGVEALRINMRIHCLETGDVVEKEDVMVSPEETMPDPVALQGLSEKPQSATFRVSIDVVAERKDDADCCPFEVTNEVALFRILSEKCLH